MVRKKRKRIPRPKKFKSGDVFWAPGTNGFHLTIVLQDHTLDNHQECIPICNFTGTPPPEWLNYVIPLGSFNLPNEWWTIKGQQKPENWIVCHPKDCIKATDHNPNLVIGNIKNDHRDLYDKLCETTKQCLISQRLYELCSCEEDEEVEIIDDTNCECENVPPNDIENCG